MHQKMELWWKKLMDNYGIGAFGRAVWTFHTLQTNDLLTLGFHSDREGFSREETTSPLQKNPIEVCYLRVVFGH